MWMVHLSEYPKPREWNARVFTVPNIPRGENGFSETLRVILNYIKNKTPYNTVLQIPGSDSKVSLDELCIRLRPVGLVHKIKNVWELSDESIRWLESCDDLYLAAVFCANIRFVGELLNALSSPATSTDLLNIAVEDFHLNWKTKSEIHNRLDWMRNFKLIDFQDYSSTYCLTDLGRQFLSTVKPIHPKDIEYNFDSTINEDVIPVSDWFLNLSNISQIELAGRKPSIGYIPGDAKNFIETIVGYVQLISTVTPIDIIYEYSRKTYRIADSSTRHFLNTLNTLGFISRKTKTHYEATELGKKLLNDQSPVNFVCCLHSRFLFVCEILSELDKGNCDVKSLAVIAKVSYGFERESVDEIRKRLHILKEALLVQDCGYSTYGLTERGKQFGKHAILQKTNEAVSALALSVKTELGSSELDHILTEIRLASRDSSNPSRFEKAIEKGFALLGFEATWLGGSGKTDVLLHAPSAPKHTYTVTVDAKSTATGSVTEGLINFDTLGDHRKQHNANYSAVIGCSFQGERLIERAIKHNIVLIDIESFEDMIRHHAQVPLQSDSYKKVFSQPGIVNLELLNEDRLGIIRKGHLLQAVMNCLAEESSDTVTQGMLQNREVYHLLKKQIQFNPPPTLEEITAMLDFLSSPLIGCIGHNSGGYFALGSLNDAANKFSFYSKACLGLQSSD